MNSITRNYVGSVDEPVRVSNRAPRVQEWIERAHSRRPRQEFWQWLHAQVRRNRNSGN